MVNFDCFLGTALNWIHHEDINISVHLCQSEFTEFTAHRFSVHTSNKVPNMKPYSSGFPIYYIPPVDPLDPYIPRCKKVYQSIVSCINWLETCTHYENAPALTFIASYRNSLHQQHYKTAIHELKCLTITN